MSLIELNRRPTQRQLREFGAVCLVVLPLVAWIWGASLQTIGIFAAVGLVLAAAGVLLPAALFPVYLGLSIVTIPIGLAVGELAMLLIYFGLLLPFGLAFRLLGRDALQLRVDRSARTYWQEKKQPGSAPDYYRQS